MTNIPTQAPTDSAVEPVLSNGHRCNCACCKCDELRIEHFSTYRQHLAEMRGGNSTVIRKEVLRCLLEHAINGRALAICEPENTYIREAEAALASPSQPSRGKCETCFAPISNPRMDCAECTARMDCAQPERQGVTFYRCTFEGNPPAPHSNWVDWAASRMYTNVLIVAHEFGLPVPERQPSPALREAARTGAAFIRHFIKNTEAESVNQQAVLRMDEQKAALLDAFAEGK